AKDAEHPSLLMGRAVAAPGSKDDGGIVARGNRAATSFPVRRIGCHLLSHSVSCRTLSHWTSSIRRSIRAHVLGLALCRAPGLSTSVLPVRCDSASCVWP